MAHAATPASPDPVQRASGGAAEASRTADHTTSGARSTRRPRQPLPAWLLPATLSLLLAVLTWQVVTSGRLIDVDHAVRGWVLLAAATATGSAITPVGLRLCDVANWQIAGGVLLLVAVAVSLLGREFRPLFVALAAAVGALAVVVPLKALIGRPGPFTPPGAFADGFYPSGHTVTAVVCFGGAAVLAGEVVGRRTARLLVGFAIALSAAVATALVWCDYHWLSDVLAGGALGGVLLCGVRLITVVSRRRAAELARDPAAPRTGPR